MPTLPSQLALTVIADGSLAVAADARNNFLAVQTETNALLGILDDGTAGQVLQGVGTTVAFGYPPGYELATATKTADTSVTATTGAAADTVLSSGAVTYDGTAVLITFYAPRIEQGTNNIQLVLYDGATQLGILDFANQNRASRVEFRLSPSAGSHTYIVKAYVDAGTGQVRGGDGASGNRMPVLIRVLKA